MSDEKLNPFDSDNFEVSSVLNGVTGKVTAAEFIRTNYGGKSREESTALRVVVEAEGLDKPREMLISAGGITPSKDGVTPDVVGPYFIGKINKNSNLAGWLDALKVGGFDISLMAKDGSYALVNAFITFKAVEKTWGKGKDAQTKTYDFPATFVGFEGEQQQAAEDLTELKTTLSVAIVDAVVAAGDAGLPRGQLSAKLAAVLKDIPNKSKALGLLVDEGFLASIPGVTYDKKILKAVVA